MQENKESKINGSEDPKDGLKKLKEILAKRRKEKKTSKAKSDKKISLGVNG